MTNLNPILEGQHTAGHINWADDGDTAYVWATTAWCASITMHRGDLGRPEFKSLVEQLAALTKKVQL